MLSEVRKICLAFPEATEQKTWDLPTFRVRGKIFAIFSDVDPDDDVQLNQTDRGGSPALARMSMKAPGGEQELLLAEGDPFFMPPYVGPRGWVGIVLGAKTDFSEIAELVEDSYRMTAPTRLLTQFAE